MPRRHLLQNTLKKAPFTIGAVSQCTARANGGNPTKRAHQLALCLSVGPAPTKFSKVFDKMARESSFQLMNSIRERFPRVKPTRSMTEPTRSMLSLILSP